MIDDSPAIPLLVRGDGRLEGPERLAAWLGLPRMPGFLSELDGGTTGLAADDLDQLRDAVRRTQKTAAPFRMVVTPRGSEKSLACAGSRPIRPWRRPAPRWSGGSISPKARASLPGCDPKPPAPATILRPWSA
jgi:hypothetical protein